MPANLSRFVVFQLKNKVQTLVEQCAGTCFVFSMLEENENENIIMQWVKNANKQQNRLHVLVSTSKDFNSTHTHLHTHIPDVHHPT